MVPEIQYRRLKIYNIVMGLLHLAQSVVILAISNEFSLPITSAFLKYNPEVGKLQPVMDSITDVPMSLLIASFLLLSAAAHLFIASPLYFNKYVKNIKKGINYIRWYEYALSASLMIIIIAMLAGLTDIAALILAFSLTATMNLCGLLMEIQNLGRKKVVWPTFYVGAFAGFIPWLAISIYFFGSISSGNIPTYVYFIFPTIFLFFFSFALNMALQYRKVGPWRNYHFGERIYMLLSLLAKSALAWQIFVGAMSRAEYL